jgi:hypothetical protein
MLTSNDAYKLTPNGGQHQVGSDAGGCDAVQRMAE